MPIIRGLPPEASDGKERFRVCEEKKDRFFKISRAKDEKELTHCAVQRHGYTTGPVVDRLLLLCATHKSASSVEVLFKAEEKLTS